MPNSTENKRLVNQDGGADKCGRTFEAKTKKAIILYMAEDEEKSASIETVKRHMSTIFEKLGIDSRKQLQMLANIYYVD